MKVLPGKIDIFKSAYKNRKMMETLSPRARYEKLLMPKSTHRNTSWKNSSEANRLYDSLNIFRPELAILSTWNVTVTVGAPLADAYPFLTSTYATKHDWCGCKGGW